MREFAYMGQDPKMLHTYFMEAPIANPHKTEREYNDHVTHYMQSAINSHQDDYRTVLVCSFRFRVCLGQVLRQKLRSSH